MKFWEKYRGTLQSVWGCHDNVIKDADCYESLKKEKRERDTYETVYSCCLNFKSKGLRNITGVYEVKYWS